MNEYILKKSVLNGLLVDSLFWMVKAIFSDRFNGGMLEAYPKRTSDKEKNNSEKSSKNTTEYNKNVNN